MLRSEISIFLKIQPYRFTENFMRQLFVLQILKKLTIRILFSQE